MSSLKVGDKIRILVHGLDLATVYRGDVLKVTHTGAYFFETEAPRLERITGRWAFGYEDEGTGWEKVTD